MAIEESKIEKRGPLVKVSCDKCGEVIKVRGTVYPDGSLRTDIKMCFCGNKDIELALVK